jgi:two-component system sensor histidine kinase/response regulator
LTATPRRSQTSLSDAVTEFLDNEANPESGKGQLYEHDLLEELKIRAREELFEEHELMLIEQAASLADALGKLTRQSVQMELADKLSRQRQEFVATLTHDLKNPLIGANRILGIFIEGHLGSLTKEQSELLQALKDSIAESLLLIGTLNDIYRLESTPGEIHKEEAEFSSIVQSSFNEMQNWSLQSNITTSLILPDKKPRILLDRSAIKRLIDNLLNNAVKFTKTSVEVRVICKQDTMVLEVEDNGEGMSEDEKRHLFQRFTQGATGKRYVGSSGLGLYLCKQIVQAHRGSIECFASTMGTAFRVTLPTCGGQEVALDDVDHARAACRSC